MSRGVMTTKHLPKTAREIAQERLLDAEEAKVLAEQEAELAAKKPGLIQAVQEAADACRFSVELDECQHAVANAWASLEGCIRALQSVRDDDDRARLLYRRARNAAIREGVPENELPQPPAALRKMTDLAPGIGEGAWPKRWR
jgi:hypothetical protein